MSDRASALQRLRASGLRPTTARIGILQVVHGAGAEGIGADQVFRQMLLCGTHLSASTVYRIIYQFEALGVLWQECGDCRPPVYRLQPLKQPQPDSGRGWTVFVVHVQSCCQRLRCAANWRCGPLKWGCTR